MRIKRYDGSKKYKFDEKSTYPGDNAKGIAEAILNSYLAGYDTRDKPAVAKGQLGPYKTLEFKFLGETKKEKRMMSVREMFIREKTFTYRVSILANPQAAREEAGTIERTLKTFAILD